MNKEEIIECTSQVRKHIFTNHIEEAMQKTVMLIEDLLCVEGSEQLKREIQEIAKFCTIAMENKDYLLLADIVYFEIPHLLENN